MCSETEYTVSAIDLDSYAIESSSRDYLKELATSALITMCVLGCAGVSPDYGTPMRPTKATPDPAV
jgi:hypothetical protein